MVAKFQSDREAMSSWIRIRREGGVGCRRGPAEVDVDVEEDLIDSGGYSNVECAHE